MTRRKFKPEFKRRVVEEWLLGNQRIAQVCRKYQLSDSPADLSQAQRVVPAKAVADADVNRWISNCFRQAQGGPKWHSAGRC